MRASSTLLSLSLIASTACATAPTAPSGRGGRDPLSFAALIETDRLLASPEMDGRLAGSAGFDRAARWAAERFRGFGLEPLGDDGYLQRLTIEYNDIERCALSLVAADGSLQALTLGPDYTCRGFTGSGAVRGEVVFVGYGISVPERGYDDYAGIDVRGRVVLAFKDAPPFTVGDVPWGASSLPRAKSNVAAAHGAVALLLVTPPSAKERRPIGSVLHGEGTQNTSMPQLHVSDVTAGSLMPDATPPAAEQGRALRDLADAITRDRKPHSRPLGKSVAIDVVAHYRANAPTANVVALLRGSDPAQAGEYVVVGAHLDHVGNQARALLFPGANDNASGSSAVLALAEALTSAAPRPRRSIVFVLFVGEEQGLNGSRWFVEHPPVPLSQVVAMANIDCIGHGTGTVELGSGKSNPRLHELALRIDRRQGRHVAGETWFGGGADAEPFFEKGVPTIYFHTTGSYTFLHVPGDTPETLGPVFERAARLAHGVVQEVARGAYTREKPLPKE